VYVDEVAARACQGVSWDVEASAVMPTKHMSDRQHQRIDWLSACFAVRDSADTRMIKHAAVSASVGQHDRISRNRN
jgi:hypothetical protein